MSSKSNKAFSELLKSPDGVEKAVQNAVREALIEHHNAGQKVPTLRDGKVVWVDVDSNGDYAAD